MSFILSDTLNRSALKDKNLPSTPFPCMEDFSMSPSYLNIKVEYSISEYYWHLVVEKWVAVIVHGLWQFFLMTVKNSLPHHQTQDDNHKDQMWLLIFKM